MVQSMRASGTIKDIKTEKANRLGLMVVSMRAIGKTIRQMEEVV